MTTIHLTGRITEDGELECELPEGTPSGEARITIEIPIEEGWTREEVEEALRIDPMTGAEIVDAGLVGGWSEEGITDGEEWVEQQRSQRRERLQW